MKNKRTPTKEYSTWKYIKAVPFFRDFLPGVKNSARKIMKVRWDGAPIDFSDEEKREILSQLERIVKLFKIENGIK